MTKTPKNLKKALAKKDKQSDDQVFTEVFGNWASFKDSTYNDHMGSPFYDLSHLAHELAKIHIGQSHSSDVLDNLSEDEILLFLKKERPMGKIGSSSDDYDDDSSSVFDRYDTYEEIKEVFKTKMADSIDSGSFLELESFNNLYNKLKNDELFSGTKEELEKILKSSSHFREFAQQEVTKYTG